MRKEISESVLFGFVILLRDVVDDEGRAEHACVQCITRGQMPCWRDSRVFLFRPVRAG